MRKVIFFILVCEQIIATFTALAQKPGNIQARPLKRETIKPIALVPPTPANFSADGYSLIETEVTWRKATHNIQTRPARQMTDRPRLEGVSSACPTQETETHTEQW